MATFYHGSPKLFNKFDLSKAGDGTGIKFGFGVYLTESEASAVHYSQPRNIPPVKDHYLYTVEIPELNEDNHLVSAKPVSAEIIKRAEAKLGKPIPQNKTQQGKEFRKWIGMMLTKSSTRSLQSEKAAADFLDSIGVFCNVWPQAQSKPDGLKNCAVFDANKVRIVKIEHIEVEQKCGKHVLVEGSRKDDLSKMPGADVSGLVEYGPFETYYTTRFASDLEKYYSIDHSCSNFPYPFVLEMTTPRIDSCSLEMRGTNRDRLNLNWAGTRHFSMFASAVFYMSACAQVIGKLHGKTAMEDFHKATGWPMLNCGMGGLMSPVQVICESVLFPYGEEIEEYLDCFREAADYLETDFFDFLEKDRANLNPSSYQALKEAVNVTALHDELARQRQLFEEWIQDPRTKYPLYYLEPKEIWEDAQ